MFYLPHPCFVIKSFICVRALHDSTPVQFPPLILQFVRQEPTTDLCASSLCITGMSVKIKREPVAQQSDVILDLSDVVWCVRGTEVWDIRGRVCWRVFTWRSAAAGRLQGRAGAGRQFIVYRPGALHGPAREIFPRAPCARCKINRSTCAHKRAARNTQITVTTQGIRAKLEMAIALVFHTWSKNV